MYFEYNFIALNASIKKVIGQISEKKYFRKKNSKNFSLILTRKKLLDTKMLMIG